MSVLKIENLSKSFANNHALCGFSAEFQPGIYTLLGPDGSGKSTLMNLITGNLSADSGEIYLDGVSTKDLGSRLNDKNIIGYMPQSSNLYPSFTVGDYLWYMAVLKNIPSGEASKQINDILDKLGLNDFYMTRIRALSESMHQLLSFAQAVLGMPDVIILDEPTSGLELAHKIAMRNYISAISAGKIILISATLVSDGEFFTDKILFIKKGVLAAYGTPKELTDRSRGRVWNIICPEGELPKWQSNFQVTKITHNAKGIILRVLSELPPCEDAVSLEPTLEDEYFAIFRSNIRMGMSV